MTADNEDVLEVDLLVVGGGMAGLTAGAFAARRGARVAVIEKAEEVGGSAVLSGGGLMRPDTAEDFVAVNPSGDPMFAELIVSNYDEAIQWVTSLGVEVTEPNATIRDLMGYPTSVCGIDIIGYIGRCAATIDRHGGVVLRSTQIVELLSDGGAVTGAVIAGPDGQHTVRAGRTLLATGGFHNDADLRGQHLGEYARSLIVRANPVSDGAGLRLATARGAATTEHMGRFYGHTIPWPLTRPFGRADYVRLIQPNLSTQSLLMNKDGCRFTDESWGYYRNAWAVVQQPDGHALLISNRRIRAADTAGGAPEKTLGYERVDRDDEARAAGANVAEADTLEELAELVKQWGYPNVDSVVSRYNAAVTAGTDLEPPRNRNREPLATGPYFAIEIQAVITNTWGGLRIDAGAHVLDAEGSPVPGLLAAGADVGAVFHEAYSGGLIFACISGIRAARTTLSELALDAAHA